jgi:tetrahydromethanopterin S-methyltransferase subunit G
MAESSIVMGRLRRLENAFVQVTEILVDHGQRFDRIERRLEGIDERLEGVTERLDRLIAVTIEERTSHYERLRDIERRLARLEERVGV